MHQIHPFTLFSSTRENPWDHRKLLLLPYQSTLLIWVPLSCLLLSNASSDLNLGSMIWTSVQCLHTIFLLLLLLWKWILHLFGMYKVQFHHCHQYVVFVLLKELLKSLIECFINVHHQSWNSCSMIYPDPNIYLQI